MSGLKLASVQPYGDHAVLIQLAENNSTAIHALAQYFLQSPLLHMNNVIPATTSLVLCFDRPVELTDDWLNRLRFTIGQIETHASVPKQHEIAVCYHPSLAPDLEYILAKLSFSLDQFISLHSQSTLVVDMLGFLPGFVYLSGQDKALKVHRKDTPSTQVPAGSVALAGNQTGIYSLASPGGWQVVGRTPNQLISMAEAVPNMWLNPLDEITIKPITLTQYKAWHNTGKGAV